MSLQIRHSSSFDRISTIFRQFGVYLHQFGVPDAQGGDSNPLMTG
jgi:hypothetical protein